MSELRKTLNLGPDGKARVNELRPKHGKSSRAPKEGHDELIARLAPVNTRIYMTLVDGTTVDGILKGSDRFTITVADCHVEDELVTTEKSPVRLFYKHSIESFQLEVLGDKG